MHMLITIASMNAYAKYVLHHIFGIQVGNVFELAPWAFYLT